VTFVQIYENKLNRNVYMINGWLNLIMVKSNNERINNFCLLLLLIMIGD